MTPHKTIVELMAVDTSFSYYSYFHATYNDTTHVGEWEIFVEQPSKTDVAALEQVSYARGSSNRTDLHNMQLTAFINLLITLENLVTDEGRAVIQLPDTFDLTTKGNLLSRLTLSDGQHCTICAFDRLATGNYTLARHGKLESLAQLLQGE